MTGPSSAFQSYIATLQTALAAHGAHTTALEHASDLLDPQDTDLPRAAQFRERLYTIACADVRRTREDYTKAAVDCEDAFRALVQFHQILPITGAAR